MSENKIGPISLKERIEVLDVLRGLAICGILLGNMQWFSGYGMMPPALAAQAPLADQITHFLVHFFIEGKFYSIFSFLFGFGFALQIARAEERGDTNASLFKRRLFWLLVIGLLHAWLLWAGDIVSIYAVMGFILVLFRKAKTETPAQVGGHSADRPYPLVHSAMDIVRCFCAARKGRGPNCRPGKWMEQHH